MEASLPKVNPQFFKPSGVVVAARGETRARVALLSGCVMPLVHGPEMSAVVRVLARNGCEVATPKAQVLLRRDHLPRWRPGHGSRPGAAEHRCLHGRGRRRHSRRFCRMRPFE